MDRDVSHPVGIRPTMTVPVDLPLENGQITCLTCHESGGVTGHEQAKRTHNGMLRTSAADDLCIRCHSAGGGRNAMHASAITTAHLRSRSRSLMGIAGSAMSLDGESLACASCHDGALASDSGMAVGEKGTVGGSHPVGITYGGPAFVSSAESALVSPGMLDARIRLFDGRIGCGSCHSMYSSQPQFLVMSNQRSQLCVSCHLGQ